MELYLGGPREGCMPGPTFPSRLNEYVSKRLGRRMQAQGWKVYRLDHAAVPIIYVLAGEARGISVDPCTAPFPVTQLEVERPYPWSQKAWEAAKWSALQDSFARVPEPAAAAA